MARYPQGATVRLTATIRDATGALANASSTLITVQHAATTTTYTTPVNDGVGLYHFDLPALDVTAADHYQWVWDATVSGFHAIITGSFDVHDPLEIAVLPLQDAKRTLNIDQADTTQDDEIARMLATITSQLERVTQGPIVTRSVTEQVIATAYGTALTVRQRPLVAVTSITDLYSGAAVSITDLMLDSNAGIIRRKLMLPFISRGPFYTVVYTAGWGTAVHPDFSNAAAIILDNMWSTQRGQSSVPAFGGALAPPIPYQTLTSGELPDQAVALLRPYAAEAYV